MNLNLIDFFAFYGITILMPEILMGSDSYIQMAKKNTVNRQNTVGVAITTTRSCVIFGLCCINFDVKIDWLKIIFFSFTVCFVTNNTNKH
jgi:hypothetical protein